MPGFLAPISLQQFVNPLSGQPYAGARADFFEAATNTRLSVYADYGLGVALPNPVIADAYGRFPAIFLDEDDEFYRLRLTSSSGSVLPLGDGGSFDISTLPIIRSSSSGDGGDVTIGTSDLSTGDVIWSPKAGTKTNFVRLNGRTIGSASSGASERANADTENLYTFYWTTFSNTIAPVTGGRGISAVADFAANKPIQLLNLRGKSPFGLTDMGGTDSGLLDVITFDAGDGTTPGAYGGNPTHTLTAAESAVLTYTSSVTDPGHDHEQRVDGGGGISNRIVAALGNGSESSTNGLNTASSTTGITVATTSNAGGQAHPQMPPFVLGTFYQRL